MLLKLKEDHGPIMAKGPPFALFPCHFMLQRVKADRPRLVARHAIHFASHPAGPHS